MVTLKQIAAAVGVSTTTVSRVLNFDSTLSISEKKRQAIVETAEALNYLTPRNRKRTSQSGMHKVVVVHFLRPDQELADPYYVGMRLGIESRCHAKKIETVTVYHNEGLPDATLIRSASGVVVIGRHDEEEIAWLAENARHLVFADYAPASDEIDAVRSDLGLAMRKLLKALTGAGYKRIGFVGWDDVYNGVRRVQLEARCRAYMEWMKEAGLFDERLCRVERNTEECGYRLTRALLQETRRPDALVAGNDNMAVGAYRAIHEAGLRIPEDIAVASFNDISVAQFLNPPLSTVRLPFEEIGETAVDLLIERARGRTLAKRVTLASTLIFRGSTAVPASSPVMPNTE
ncbi:LacI family DNA-binding transcriptional regulator [Pelagibacterium limicola]|uniref:LacI family DNA-binding transcriptional regulator n=1 Tax=Pelagibacterium limicola TaxID=2791022 RepID=UPI0018AFFD8E|nr:LacI family DNA-binding transcriptional regulator [Pelagibacterium limicola]